MSEFEMAYLLTDIQSTLTEQLSLLLSVVSAFLAVSYFAAHRLSRAMLTMVIGVYVFWCLSLTAMLERELISHGGLLLKMRNAEVAGHGLEWHAVAHWESQDWVVKNTPWILSVLLVVAMIASIGFCIHCRRENGKAGLRPGTNLDLSGPPATAR